MVLSPGQVSASSPAPPPPVTPPAAASPRSGHGTGRCGHVWCFLGCCPRGAGPGGIPVSAPVVQTPGPRSPAAHPAGAGLRGRPVGVTDEAAPRPAPLGGPGGASRAPGRCNKRSRLNVWWCRLVGRAARPLRALPTAAHRQERGMWGPAWRPLPHRLSGPGSDGTWSETRGSAPRARGTRRRRSQTRPPCTPRPASLRGRPGRKRQRGRRGLRLTRSHFPLRCGAGIVAPCWGLGPGRGSAALCPRRAGLCLPLLDLRIKCSF